jgi:tetratricopeptide (TPR) repeat protein
MGGAIRRPPEILMNNSRIVTGLALLVMVVSLGGAAAVVPVINQERKVLQLGFSEKLGEAMPPHIAIAVVALGPFRGLLVDVLWYRANEMKEAGDYFEANQLSEWITTLQPRFAQVWAFHAWNMAYNISVATHTPDERWDWVNKGIRLLRDKGIPYNPRAVRLYRELSWIFFHKVGRLSDDMHWFYKQQLAMEWQEILGGLNDGASTKEVIEQFRPITQAADTLLELQARKPLAIDLVMELSELGRDYIPGQSLLRRCGRVAMLNYSRDAAFLNVSLENLPKETPEADRKLVALLTSEKYKDVWPDLLAHMRKRVLIDNYNMDPDYMLYLMEEFGPIDWRHPAGQGVYWASMGTKKADELRSNEEVDLINTYRGNIHSLQSLTQYGRLSFDPISGHIDVLPDPRFIDSYEKYLQLAYDALDRQSKENVKDSYASGHENFLLEAMRLHYLYGDVDKAREYHRRAMELYGALPHNQFSGRYNQPMADLIVAELTEGIDLMHGARTFIDAMIQRAMREGLAVGSATTYARYLELAEKVREKYMKNAVTTATVNESLSRMGIPPIRKLVEESMLQAMQSPSYALLFRARVWANMPLEIRQRIFDRMKDVTYQQAQQSGYDPARMFPEPEGMDEVRKAMEQEAKTLREAQGEGAKSIQRQ